MVSGPFLRRSAPFATSSRPQGEAPASPSAHRSAERGRTERATVPDAARQADGAPRSSELSALSGYAAAKIAFDAIPDALILIGSDLRIQILNNAARELLSAHRSLKIVDGRLEGATVAESAQIRSLCDQAVHGLTDALECRIRCVQRPGADVLLSATAVAASEGDASKRRGLVLLSLWADRSSPELGETLSSSFGLSPAETRVVLRLFAGDSLREAAEVLGVTFSTVRVQLQSVFAKTGVNRQAQLLRLLTRLSGGEANVDKRNLAVLS